MHPILNLVTKTTLGWPKIGLRQSRPHPFWRPLRCWWATCGAWTSRARSTLSSRSNSSRRRTGPSACLRSCRSRAGSRWWWSWCSRRCGSKRKRGWPKNKKNSRRPFQLNELFIEWHSSNVKRMQIMQWWSWIESFDQIWLMCYFWHSS